jgi:RNA polymerase sigma factor (sigma-70 family)
MGGSDFYIDSSDDEILGPLRQDPAGKRKAEELLFRKHLYFIREGMTKYKLSEEQAFDAYSDTILAALQTITAGSFESRSSLKTYLFRIFNNKCVDVLRKTATNKNMVHQAVSITDMFLQLSDNAKTILQQLMEKADHSLLRKRLNELGEKCKQLLMLSADGNSDKELAVQLDYKTASVVKTSRLRCMERLRQLYQINK